jgi:hypothetical protein
LATLKLPYSVNEMFFQHLKIKDVGLHISRITNREPVINSIDSEKAFENIQWTSTTKTLNNLPRERMYLNMIKVLHNKHTLSIRLKVGKMNIFPLRTETRLRCSLLTLLCNIFMEVLVRA